MVRKVSFLCRDIKIFLKLEIYLYESTNYAGIDVGKNVAELPCRFSLFVFISSAKSVRLLCFDGSLEGWVMQDSE